MSPSFYEPCGSLISPGDILADIPPVKLPIPLRVARRWSYNLPTKYKVQGKLHDVLEIGKDMDIRTSELSGAGEEILLHTKTSRGIFLTWGSEVEDDERSGKVDKKDWLIAPIFPVTLELSRQTVVGTVETMAAAIRGNKSARFFFLPSLPIGEGGDHYVDFRKICPVAAGHVRGISRTSRLSSPALNDFYHQLIWFFTRKRMFFEPLMCDSCGAKVDLNLTFEGQPIDPEPPD